MEPFTQKVKFNEWVNLSFDNLISESDTTITAGLYNAPLEIGAYKWKNELKDKFDSEVIDILVNRYVHSNKDIKLTNIKKMIDKTQLELLSQYENDYKEINNPRYVY